MDKQSNSTTAPFVSIGEAAQQLVESLQPHSTIMQVARELGAAERLRESYEMAKKKMDATRKRTMETMESDASDRAYALRDLLTHRKASTLTEAAVQMCEIITRVDMIWDQFPEEAAEYRTKQDHRAFERLAFSVLDLLTQLAEERPEDATYSGFSNQHMNPWTAPEVLFELRGLNREAGK